MKKDSNEAAPPKKAVRFKPKIPARKQRNPAVTKTQPSEAKDDIVDKELLSKLSNARLQGGFGRTKTDRKGPAQVAFGQGSTSLIRTFGNPKEPVSEIKPEDGSDASAPRSEKVYVESWDYIRSYYPVTLPLRRPYSGDPEIQDQEEFGEASASSTVLEPQINPAKELELMELTEGPRMLFFQFPVNLPLEKKFDAAKDMKVKNDSATKKGCNLRDLPAGFMGKMLVYKSGKIKMKLGDVLFDVFPGEKCVFAEDVTAINVKEKHFCNLGELQKHVMVTPEDKDESSLRASLRC